MKILKYLLGAVALLVLLFFALGFLKPTISYGHQIEVNKSIEEAWAVQQDESKLGEWLDGFKSIEHLSGELGMVGSKYKITVIPEEGADEFFMTETIISKKENDHMTLNMDSDMMVFDQTTYFSERDGKTVIKTDSKVKGKGMIMRSMFALMNMSGSFTAQEAKNIEQLKKVIESNTTDYFPAPVIEEIIEEG